jgi:hypothetical protein
MCSGYRVLSMGLALIVIVLGPGCAPKMPPVVPVSGTVYLDGKPLPLARVEFVPDLKNFGAESNSSAVTDEEGRYTLICNVQQQSGAVVATHHVLVIEHIPDELRGMSEKSQRQLVEYQAKLKNRPIPEDYSNVSKSPLTVEVKPGQATYDLHLTRGR